MRNLVRLVLIGAFAAGTVAATTVGAGAGVVTLKVNKVTVVKVVDGPVDPNTTFTVGVDCTQLGLSGSAGTTAAQHTDIIFDWTGQPKGPSTVNVGAGVACTATETVNGGATSTTYACDIERAPAQAAQTFQSNCTADNAARFDDVLGDTAIITVTNTFPAAPPIQPIVPAAQAVQAAPAFTG